MRNHGKWVFIVFFVLATRPAMADSCLDRASTLSPPAQVDEQLFTTAFADASATIAHVQADRGKGFFSGVEEGRGREAQEGYQGAVEFLREKIMQEVPLSEPDVLALHKLLGRTTIEITPELAMHIANGGIPAELGNANVPGEYRRSALLGLPYLEHPLPKAIPQLISALIDWMNEQDDEIARLEEAGADIRPQVLALAGRVHYLIGIIHPFTDGNGRIARLLTRYLLEKHGYEIAGETREEYDETFGRDFKHNFGIAYGTKRVNIEKAAWPELLAKSNAPAFEGFLTAHVRELSEETQAVYELLEKKEVARYFKEEAGVDADLFMAAIRNLSLGGQFAAENIQGIIADNIAQAVSFDNGTIQAGKTEAGLLKEIIMDTNRESLTAHIRQFHILFPETLITNLEYFLAETATALRGERAAFAPREYMVIQEVLERVRQLVDGAAAGEFPSTSDRVNAWENQTRFIENAI
ncbi:MAG: Fic family protein [Candidatus Omnitrophica bacterium]|nr:Fic family protein [Candidatus Omnitrophota bacterium]